MDGNIQNRRNRFHGQQNGPARKIDALNPEGFDDAIERRRRVRLPRLDNALDDDPFAIGGHDGGPEAEAVRLQGKESGGRTRKREAPPHPSRPARSGLLREPERAERA